jgi:hypothetical protein
VTIIDTIEDPELFARWFKNKATWQAWFAFIAALFGVPMAAEQLSTYLACTGRSEEPTEPFTEAWLICGRRAGKSIVLAPTAVFLACFKSYPSGAAMPLYVPRNGRVRNYPVASPSGASSKRLAWNEPDILGEGNGTEKAEAVTAEAAGTTSGPSGPPS